MKLKDWLMFSVAAAFVVVLYLGVREFATFNQRFYLKDFSYRTSSGSSTSVVALPNGRIAVADGSRTIIYSVDAGTGDLTVDDTKSR
ncbi:hypothetical protein EON83_27620 [bacterium]|nr:MAG: hypothetical protein EON83_27620 [bacterium]